MFKWIAKLFGFLTSSKATKALDTAEKVAQEAEAAVDTVRSLRDKVTKH